MIVAVVVVAVHVCLRGDTVDRISETTSTHKPFVPPPPPIAPSSKVYWALRKGEHESSMYRVVAPDIEQEALAVPNLDAHPGWRMHA